MKKQNKINGNITVDPNIWALAKDKLPVSRSEFFENQVKLFLDIDDPETKIVKKIEKKQNEINVLKDKLCQIRDNKQKLIESEENLKEPLRILERIYKNAGVIGRNQIRSIAHKYDVPSNVLEGKCNDSEMAIVNFYEPPKK